MRQQIQGVIPVVHTPFDEHDCIHEGDLRREVDWAFQCGADGICTGMVSEILRLSDGERNQLANQLVEFTEGRGAVIASVGAESTKLAVEFAREAERAGCDAMMAIPPTSVALSDEETWNYFRSLAEAVTLPLIVQDASSYVGKAIGLDVYLRLLDQYGPERIMFKPEAAPLGPNLSALRDASDGKARIFEGSGGLLIVDSFRRGISGTIPGMDLLDGIVAIWKALEAGDEQKAYRIYFPLCAMVALQIQAGLDGFLAIEKYILVKRGIFSSDRRRGPLAWRLDDETRLEVDRLFTRFESA